jgi:hypothetical protein
MALSFLALPQSYRHLQFIKLSLQNRQLPRVDLSEVRELLRLDSPGRSRDNRRKESQDR